MENIVLLTIAISVLFISIKIIEMRFVDKEMKPLKNIVRDAFIVAACSFVPIWGYFQFKDKMASWFGISPSSGGDSAAVMKTPEIFTDNPGF
jgi:hypothetical protein